MARVIICETLYNAFTGITMFAMFSTVIFIQKYVGWSQRDNSHDEPFNNTEG